MSEKTKKNVPLVEEKKPAQDSSEVETSREKLREESKDEALRQQQEDLTSAVPEKSPEETTVAPMPFDISKVDPDKIKMAEDFGIPIRALAQWASSVEARFNALEQNLPKEIKQAFQQTIEAERQKQFEQMKKMGQNPQAPQQGGGLGIGIGDILRLVTQGGGGDSEMTQLTKDLMRLNLERMKADMGFTDAIKDAVVRKIAGKAVGKIMEE